MQMNKKTVLAFAGVAAVAAVGTAAALLGGQGSNRVTSVVSLDVNPSIELSINQKERILSASALNEEASAVLADMDLEGSDLSVGVKAILASLLEHGYLSDPTSSIFICVEDEDIRRAAAVEGIVDLEVDAALKGANSPAVIHTDAIEADPELRERAKQHGVSVGKEHYVRQVAKRGDDLDPAQLATLTSQELDQLLYHNHVSMPIGRDAAYNAALTASGLSQSDVLGFEVESELDEKPPYYEVELTTANGEQEYHVDAFTGTVSSAGGTTPHKPDGSDIDPGMTAGVTEEQAIDLALQHAAVSRPQVKNLTCKLDTDDGVTHYDIQFYIENLEYSYEIDAKTGAILKAEQEKDDDLPSASKPQKPEGLIGEDAAKQAAFSHAGVSPSKVKNLTCKLDTDDGVTLYEIQFFIENLEYSYEIDAKSGKILKAEQERDDDLPAASKPQQEGLLGEAAAKQAALSHAGLSQAQVTNLTCELDYDDGIARYEVEFDTDIHEYSYEIDAKSGKILKAEKEVDDH